MSSSHSEMPQVSDMPTDGMQRSSVPASVSRSHKKPQPFVAVDNPTISPAYCDDVSPDPVQDWTLQQVSDEPTDAPRPKEHSQSAVASAGGGASEAASPLDASAPTAPSSKADPPTGSKENALDGFPDSSDLEQLDALLLESGGLDSEFNSGGSVHNRDWEPEEFGHQGGNETVPKKRRMERPVLQDEFLDVAMPAMPMGMGLAPLDFDPEHQGFDFDVNVHDPSNVCFDHETEQYGMMYEHEMNPDLAFSCHPEEEELYMPMHMHPRAHHHHHQPRPFSGQHRQMHPHAQMQMQMHAQQMYAQAQAHPRPGVMPPRRPHPQQRQAMMRAMHPRPDPQPQMDGCPPEEHEAIPSPAHSSRKGPALQSPHQSPAPMHGRRMVAPAMGRSPGVPQPVYRPRYMNAYVPVVPVPPTMASPMGNPNNPYFRRAYPRHQGFPRYMNPANLPSPHVRRAYRIPPSSMGQRRGSTGGAPYFVSAPEDDPFWTQQGFFAASDGTSGAPVDVDGQGQSPNSIVAFENATSSRSRSADMNKRMSLPAMKLFSGPGAAHQQNQAGEVEAVDEPQEEVSLDVLHFETGKTLSLATDEDANWLSEFQTYVRQEFLELFRANEADVTFRNTSRKVDFKQLGIRCKFCSHIEPGKRIKRSSAYPSSTAQIYQSFNMMIRDHFPNCEHVPKDKMAKFLELKNRNNQGAADSKHYWRHAAEKIGMVDSGDGIHMNDATQRTAVAKSPFSATSATLAVSRCAPVLLVVPDDKPTISPFLFELLSRVQKVHLLDCERRSTRKNLKVGLPGFGCRYCMKVGSLGFSRVFPTKRKGLPEKANDMYDHFRRCALCPQEVKLKLEKMRTEEAEGVCPSTEKAFFDRMWARLNDDGQP